MKVLFLVARKATREKDGHFETGMSLNHTKSNVKEALRKM